MSGRKGLVVLLILVMVLGFVLTACGTMAPAAPRGARAQRTVERAPSWAEYTRIPFKDYVVVGAVIVRQADPRPSARI